MNSKLSVLVAASCLIASITAHAQTATLLTTFTNPTPLLEDKFGSRLCAVGSDKVLIGAYSDDTVGADTGAAYLFSTNGTLLVTFTNSTDEADSFGASVTTVGSDKVLIGAPDFNISSGTVYLFSTNGTKLFTFTNPTPQIADSFGAAIVAVGTDKVLISAPGDAGVGAAHLFSTNGTKLLTFSNPTPQSGDSFGNAVAAVGSDKVLIGAFSDNTGAANAGSVYLFSTNGTLLRTFTNPTPVVDEGFGRAIAALEPDRVVINSPEDSTAGQFAGAVYVFGTNGTLLTTITNPMPQVSVSFGISLAVVGSDKLLIGTPFDDRGANSAGVAYLFSANGTLLTTITNPAPAFDDEFGISVAAVGSDKVLIGAFFDDTGDTDAGAAYLFNLETSSSSPSPVLTIVRTAPKQISISWSPNTAGFVLQETLSLTPTNWGNSPSGATNPVVIPATSPMKSYRLSK